MLLTEALELGVYLDPEQLAFLADNGDTVTPVQASQEIRSPAAFQTDDLDAFDSDCNDAPSAKAVLMANLSSYDSDVLSECSEQPSFDNDTEVDITSDSNIISYEKYLQETEISIVQSTSSSTQQNELLMSVIEEMSSHVAKFNKKSKDKEYKYLDEVIDLQKKNKALDNVVYKIVPALYDGHTIVKQHDSLSVPDIEKTLELAEERVSSSTGASRLKPRSNIKKDRISQTSYSNKKTNKVEDQPRIGKSSLNNMNRVSKTVCNANVKHSVLNANSELICATCHECMFDTIHDLCVSYYLNDVNARVKTKSVISRSAKSKKKKM
ncbi:copia protein [Tanacetum coccineum]|uniref:Copia protein n=1 Tax=Tanacetum coccineum TaxID=301880 RepID=A0ABQ5HV17_9ASTR